MAVCAGQPEIEKIKSRTGYQLVEIAEAGLVDITARITNLQLHAQRVVGEDLTKPGQYLQFRTLGVDLECVETLQPCLGQHAVQSARLDRHLPHRIEIIGISELVEKVAAGLEQRCAGRLVGDIKRSGPVTTR